MKTYIEFVKAYRKLFQNARKVPMGKSAGFGEGKNLCNSNELRISDSDKKVLHSKIKKLGLAPRVLVFAPHPDDECMNSLAVRFMTECGFEIVDVAVTLGSNVARRKGRLVELKDACNFMGWKIAKLAFDRINPKARTDKKYWSECVDKTVALIEKMKPAVIIAPHIDDWNKTHIGTSMLVSDALAKSSWKGVRIEAELWQAMETPNLLIEVSDGHLSAQIGALSCHTKEVERNPYHLNLPAYYTDNVRRGAEIVGGQGGDAPSFQFGQIYRVLERRGKSYKSAFTSKVLTATDSVAELLTQLWK